MLLNKSQRTRIIKKTFNKSAEELGFHMIPYLHSDNVVQGWIYFRKKNELSQDFAIELIDDGEIVLVLSAVNIPLFTRRVVINDAVSFEDAALKLFDIASTELFPELELLADDDNRIMRKHEEFFYNHFDELLERFIQENPTAEKASFVEGCHLIDSYILKYINADFKNALDVLYFVAAYMGFLLQKEEDSNLLWDVKGCGVVVERKNAITPQMRLLNITYNIWDNKCKRSTILFVRSFFLNKEIMEKTSIRDELVRLNDFDPMAGY